MNQLSEALTLYGLDHAHAVFLQHNENLTYRVNDVYLLRIHSPAPGIHAPCTPAQRRAELAFLTHLQCQGIPVQEPIPTPSGDTVALLADGTAATLLRWLPGEVLPMKDYTPGMCTCLGRLAETLHRAARGFDHPDLRRYDAPAALAKVHQLTDMVERHHLGQAYADLLSAACQAVAECVVASPDVPIPIHNDLSASNILQTPEGPVPIDFSLCGLGQPMTDLGMLLASCHSTVQRKAVVDGYTQAGGILRHRELEAGYIDGLLGAFVFHADTWPREPWFPDRLRRWDKELLCPFAEGRPILDSSMNLIHLPQG